MEPKEQISQQIDISDNFGKQDTIVERNLFDVI